MRQALSFLKPVENRETFFKRISQSYSVYDWRYTLILKAYNGTKDAFREKYREDGTRYFEHARDVALISHDYLRIRDYRYIILGLLHDTHEDILSWSLERIRDEFGEEMAMFVDYISKPSKKIYSDKNELLRIYYDKLQNAPRLVIIIKLADRLHNLTTLWACPKEKILRKIEETKRYYLPLAEKETILIHEIESAIADLEKRLKTVELPVKPTKKKGGK